jgi:hypothetical protein
MKTIQLAVCHGDRHVNGLMIRHDRDVAGVHNVPFKQHNMGLHGLLSVIQSDEVIVDRLT